MNRPVGVTFASKALDDAFEGLKEGRHEEKRLYLLILRAIQELRSDMSRGTKIPREYWPRFYDRYIITNLWKYDLPDGWRLIYSINFVEKGALVTILEWFGHKGYEKRFGYKT